MNINEEVRRFEECEGVKLPLHKEVCPDCDGEGSHAKHLGAYTQADREEMGEEWYEFIADVTSGHYDRPCEGCAGLRVIDVVDEHLTDPAVLKEWFAWLADGYESEAIERMERRMGA